MGNRVKYPRTPHLPWSPGAQNDDKIHATIDQWYGMEVVITEKFDGECTSMTREYIHARSLENLTPHPSRTFIKALWGRIAHNIPNNFIVCGENVTAVHSIEYYNLSSYFFVFNIWDGEDCLSWDDTCEYASMLALPTVPELYRGPWKDGLIDSITRTLDTGRQEGIVMRPAKSFARNEFTKVMAKWVRAEHVNTADHWMTQQIRFNQLKNKYTSPEEKY